MPATRDAAAPRVHVRGVDRSGSLCFDQWLRHGDDPHRVLLAGGWQIDSLVSITTLRTPDVEIALDYRVARVPAQQPEAYDVPRAPGLIVADGERPVRFQRVAAYAVVTSDRGTLMSQASRRTGVAGQWGLPGGGLDADEDPDDAVVREVWEETGQHVQLSGPLDVVTQHWVGRAPSGRLEDFHAIRLVYRAGCATPTDPVVHDVGGTTAASAWMDGWQIGRVRVTRWAQPLLSRSYA
ncbi:NUDIX domain-containing protein [Luteipulveratus sp. YIM 133132]|uniref:NUDIX hydrolase n=1 Tax=Luteipulveratus flavus TaxID=3031728 RepID=UPI0023AF4B11|nr:NUDIX domain-containing protein [Luteipulveratus sp. YIM 133132]MDE9367145.1 NUDIX domain-containing protein [Luteipulveratus sp. YIM 133132]